MEDEAAVVVGGAVVGRGEKGDGEGNDVPLLLSLLSPLSLLSRGSGGQL